MKKFSCPPTKSASSFTEETKMFDLSEFDVRREWGTPFSNRHIIEYFQGT